MFKSGLSKCGRKHGVCLFLSTLLILIFLLIQSRDEAPGLSQSYYIQNTSLPSLPALMLTQRKRLLRLETVCGRVRGVQERELNLPLDFTHPQSFHPFFYDDLHKVIYCEVPKVACTNWKRIMLMLSGRINVSRPEQLASAEVHSSLERSYLRRMDQLDAAGIKHRLDPKNKYFKFLFVRDPAERLLSAYRNKFASAYGQYFQHRFGRKIIRKFRANPSNESLAKGHDVTFAEFIKYIVYLNRESPIVDSVVDEHQRNLNAAMPLVRHDSNSASSNSNTSTRLVDSEMNAHWRPIYKLCRPCSINYDVIGKLESSEDDARIILSRLNMDDFISFPPSYRLASEATNLLTDNYYRTISEADLIKLRSIYALDADIFGYQHIPFLEDLKINLTNY